MGVTEDESAYDSVGAAACDVHGVYIQQGGQCTKGDVNVGFLSIMNGGQ